ncbi:protein O-mannosyl-transferase TMEM260-like [Liolophura sinensis]|uniref:protein O-mannosyl-transferase TMEM260-like n=1 Tax=Liolophura sinensis TaxID=3198878 RepID=UPI0031580CAA
MTKNKKNSFSPSRNHAREYRTDDSCSRIESVRTSLWDRRWLPDVQLSVIVTMATLSLYLKTLHPSIAGGDSGELVTSAHEVGVAHPPGYPLFTMTAKVIIEMLPMSNVAWRVNLLNAIYSATSAGLLMLAVIRQTGCWSSGLLAVSLFSASRVAWFYSVVAEVFALNNLFVALLMVLAAWFESSRSSYKLRAAKYGAFVCGLSLCNQHTISVYVACFALWVLATLYKLEKLTIRTLIQLSGLFLAGLLPYAYLPLSAYLQPGRWTWGDQRTVSGFLTHLLREEYGTFRLANDETDSSTLTGLRINIQHVFSELTFVCPVLAVYGLFVAWKRYRRGHGSSLCVMVVMLLLYTGLFAWRANLDTSNPLLLGVVERFWLQSDLMIVVLAGVAFNHIFSFLSDRFHQAGFVQAILPCLLLLYQVNRNWSLCDQSGNQVVYEFGKTVMDSMPPHAIVLTKGDLSSNVIRYLSLCENYRPDLQVFDQEVLTYPWAVPMLSRSQHKLKFPGEVLYTQDGMVHDPTGGLSFTFRSFLDANYDRYPIFGCVGVQEHEPSWQSKYELWPFGTCSKFVKKGTEFEPELWAKMTGHFGMHWAHPYQGFDITSWDHVANEEMWNAKIRTAAFLYDMGQHFLDQEDMGVPFFLQAYKLYLRAMENNAEYPVFWHKNFALVCRMLINMPNTDLDRLSLVDETIRQFQIYIDETPHEEDPSVEHIKPTIAALHDFKNQMYA